MATVAELEKQLEELKVKNQSLQDELKAKQVVKYLPSTQKLCNFEGKRGTVKKWIADCKRHVSLQGLTGKNEIDFILAHLEGDAEEEVKFELDDTKCTAQEVYDFLLEEFQEQLDSSDVYDEFLLRRQRNGESLRDYASSLRKLLDRAIDINPNCVTNKDEALRDRFVQKLSDKHLRDHLKVEIRKKPAMKFKEVKKEALLYSEDDRNKEQGQRRARVELAEHEAASLDTPEAQYAGRVDSTENRLDKMLELQRLQGEQLATQQKLITELMKKDSQKSDKSTEYPTYKKQEDTMRCFFCQKPGHVKRNCHKYKNWLRRQGEGGRPSAAQVSAYSQVAPNVLPFSQQHNVPQYGYAPYAMGMPQAGMTAPSQMASHNPFLDPQRQAPTNVGMPSGQEQPLN